LNPDGWVYVSNSETTDGKGGVGRIKFDMHGNVLDYKMLLTGTSYNCGGGKTPWNTWVSCEEVLDIGQLYQVDPTGNRPPELMPMASEGGMWESFAYDDRDQDVPRFFVSEDHHKCTL
jgi:secreted PhoX family phosphatase